MAAAAPLRAVAPAYATLDVVLPPAAPAHPRRALAVLTAVAVGALAVGSLLGTAAAEYYAVAPRAALAPTTASLAVARAPLLAAEQAVEEEVTAKAAELAVEEKEDPSVTFWGQKTYYPKLADTEAINKKWYIVDAAGLRLGRMATVIASLLRGTDTPAFHPAMDMGAYVVVINAEKVVVSGKKASQKLYRRHATGVPGSMKEETFDQLQRRIPERIVEKAVKGMLPHNSLGRSLFTHLKVFKGASHPHAAQKPEEFRFEGRLAKAAEPIPRR